MSLAEEFRLFQCQYFENPPFYRGGWMYATDQYLPHFQKDVSHYSADLADNFRSALKQIIARQALHIKGARLIDKSQTYSLKIPLLHKLLEDADPRFVAVCRNPYTMILKQIHKPALSLQKNISEEERLVLACQHYRNTYREILQRTEQYENVELWYLEDFLNDPADWVRDLCELCELTYSPGMLPQPDDRVNDKWYPIRKSRNESVIEEAPSAYVQVVTEQLGELIPQLGYTRL